MASIGIGFGIENPRFPSIGIGIGIDFLSIESIGIGIGIDFGPVRGIGIGIGLAKLVLSVSDHNFNTICPELSTQGMPACLGA